MEGVPERARAAAPGFDVPPDSDAMVAELVERIDRLPLAIEMAAQWQDLALTIHPHPTLSESIMEAAETLFAE